MNFLAHIYLSGDNEGIILGNFMADAVKGRNYSRFKAEQVLGITLHRYIDSFTDQHPVVSSSKKRLYEHYHHYAGVVVDVFYDHFLAHNWEKYAAIPLNEFAQQFYILAQRNAAMLPERTRVMLPYMIKGNWLYNYRETEGIGKALSGMARRTSFPSGMEHAINDLIKNYKDFEHDFNAFFPELQKAVGDWFNINLTK